MDGPATGPLIPSTTVTHEPLDRIRHIKTPEQRTKYNRAIAAARKHAPEDRWYPLDRFYDPDSMIETIVELNVDTEHARITKRFHGISQLLEENKALANESARNRTSKRKDLTLAARIPPNLAFGAWQKPMAEGDDKWLNRQLNGDFKDLKTYWGAL